MTEKKKVEELLARFQIESQQLETILLQKQRLILEKSEIEEALKQIKDKNEVYKIVGPIIVKSSPKKLENELKEKKEEIEIRMRSIEKNEKRLREMIEKDRKEIEKILPSLQR